MISRGSDRHDDESERNEETMSFTNVDTGFSAKRYSFDGPDFGPIEASDVADAGAVVMSLSSEIDELLDSIEARVEDEPDTDTEEDDEEDEEEQDDDTDSEKAWVSSPGIRF
jgi:hypothetical protein